MNVAHFSTYTSGGAAIAARRLHDALVQDGIKSRFYHRSDAASPNATYSVLQEKPIDQGPLASLKKNWIRFCHRSARRLYRQHLAERPASSEVFSVAQQFMPTEVDFTKINADVINLHWTSFWLDYESFFASVPTDIPIVWTLHDMNLLTGGCHYAGDCVRFRSGCGHCPQIAHPGLKDISADTFRRKQNVLRNRQLHVVSPSQWLMRLARTSPILPAHTRFHVIPYGLDTDLFSPIHKRQAKDELSINPEHCVIMFGAEDITNPRKGFEYLWQALPMLADLPVTCALFGNGELPKTNHKMPEIRRLGFLSNDEQKALVYSAADMFVLPSLEDNQPQTALEAMACGTPVVAFEAGGVPEYVIDRVTGRLAEPRNTDQLAQIMRQLCLNPFERSSLGIAAREMIEQRFDKFHQASNYQRLYRDSSCSETGSPARVEVRKAG
jgi:glycosyltransferase involved in cell wall biosynthesis